MHYPKKNHSFFVFFFYNHHNRSYYCLFNFQLSTWSTKTSKGQRMVPCSSWETNLSIDLLPSTLTIRVLHHYIEIGHPPALPSCLNHSLRSACCIEFSRKFCNCYDVQSETNFFSPRHKISQQYISSRIITEIKTQSHNKTQFFLGNLTGKALVFID